MVTKVPAESDVLRWARDACRLSVDRAADKLKISKEHLEKVEAGEIQPSASLFRRMARVYALPEATLLSASAPSLPSLPKDFRAFEGRTPTVSYETIVAIRHARSRQDDLAELAEYSDEIHPPKVPTCKVTDNHEKIAERERLRFKFSRTTQRQLNSQKIFLFIRMAVEELGISVYFEDYPLQDTRGISLFDNEFPAIICNQNEKRYGARSFTILHEYCHLMLRQAGLSDFNRTNRVERFCNQFAAAFLLPKSDVATYFVKDVEPNIAELERVAAIFGSTISQVALRLEEMDYVREGFYNEIRSIIEPNVNKKKSKGPKFRYMVLSSLGHNLTGAVIKSVQNGTISKFEATRILQVSPQHFGAVADVIKQRRIDFAYE